MSSKVSYAFNRFVASFGIGITWAARAPRSSTATRTSCGHGQALLGVCAPQVVAVAPPGTVSSTDPPAGPRCCVIAPVSTTRDTTFTFPGPGPVTTTTTAGTAATATGSPGTAIVNTLPD